jgi:hypothetical protein
MARLDFSPLWLVAPSPNGFKREKIWKKAGQKQKLLGTK